MALVTSDPTDEQEKTADLLTHFVRSRIPEAQELCLDDVSRLSGGLSRENWVFRARWRDGDGNHDLPMIMRRDPAGSLLDTDRYVEFELLRALESTPIPAPPAHWIDVDGSWLGSPSLVMGRVEGVCDLFVLNGERPLTERAALARQFLELLIAVQQVDWRSLGLGKLLNDPGPDAGLTEVGRWEDELRRNQLEPIPELDLVSRWLRDRARPSQRTVLVHGDFKPGNALLGGDKISALLDWETAHLGDPLEDLGWITNPVRRREHQIPGVWERKQIVEAYTQITGYTVDPDELLWWNVFSCWKLAVIVLTGVRVFVDGTFDRVHQSPTWLFRAMFKMMEN